MEREASREASIETDRKNGKYLQKLLVIGNKSSCILQEESVEGEGGSEVPIGRHPCIGEIKEHHPAVTSSWGQGLLSRGNKRISKGGTASPAKRKNFFSNLLTYWEKKTDSGNPKNINYGINLQSEISQPGSGSEEVRGSYNQGDGDDSTRGDLYMPGGAEG